MKSIKQQLLFALIVFSSLYTNAQNVGIGTNIPAYTLDVHSTGNSQLNLTEGVGGRTALFSRYTNRLEIEPSDAFQISVGAIAAPHFFINSSGYVGIGTTTPTTKLQVLTADGSYGIIHTNGTVTVGTYIGDGGGWLGTGSNNPLYFFTNNSSPLVTLATNGNFGIGTTIPANILQVGTYTNPGYSGNQLALGYGTNVTALNQYPSYFNLQSSSAMNIQSASNIYLMPGNGSGFVGIGTNTPSAPLEVDGKTGSITDYGYAYFNSGGNNSSPSFSTGTGTDEIDNLAIIADGAVAGEFIYSFSDARIKDIEGITDNEKDLATLNAIRVTNYTMKDKVMNGNKQFKKVIAQQVETVYPQVVSKHTDFIPNVYQLTDKIEKTSDGYLLTFKNKHHIDGSAKKLQLIMMNGEKQLHDIVAIPSDYQVLIHSENITDKEVFVYGEQVNDFRTVDYDGLTTLNISATQELSKLVKQQQQEIDAQNAKIEELMEMIKKLKKKHSEKD